MVTAAWCLIATALAIGTALLATPGGWDAGRWLAGPAVLAAAIVALADRDPQTAVTIAPLFLMLTPLLFTPPREEETR